MIGSAGLAVGITFTEHLITQLSDCFCRTRIIYQSVSVAEVIIITKM